MFILVIRREKNDKKRFQFQNIVLNNETNRNIVFGVFSFFLSFFFFSYPALLLPSGSVHFFYFGI